MNSLTSQLLVAFKEGLNPFVSLATRGSPQNIATTKAYTGPLWLELSVVMAHLQTRDPRFGTKRQFESVGGSLRPGSLCHALLDFEDKNTKTRVNVGLYHASQVDGLAPFDAPTVSSKAHLVQSIVEALQPRLEFDPSKKNAQYCVSKDLILMPPLEKFAHSEHFYSTVIHELGHWSGAPGRLNRYGLGADEKPHSAVEELTCELVSLLFAQNIGLAYQPDRHSGYLPYFAKALEKRPEVLDIAIVNAFKAYNYLLK